MGINQLHAHLVLSGLKLLAISKLKKLQQQTSKQTRLKQQTKQRIKNQTNPKLILDMLLSKRHEDNGQTFLKLPGIFHVFA